MYGEPVRLPYLKYSLSQKKKSGEQRPPSVL